jgi:hypothetical protein
VYGGALTRWPANRFSGYVPTSSQQADHGAGEARGKEEVVRGGGDMRRDEDVDLIQLAEGLRKREEEASRREMELDQREEAGRRKEADIVPRWAKGKEEQVNARKRVEELRAREDVLKGREAAVLRKRADRDRKAQA